MFECKVCGREFKTMQELGGHVGNAHPKQEPEHMNLEQNTGSPTDVKEVVEKPVDETKTQTSPPITKAQLPPPASSSAPSAQAQEPSEADQIRGYLRQGITFEQLTTKLGFKPSTVRQVAAKMIIEEKPAAGKLPTLPLVLKDGKGEMIAPESVYHQLVADDGIGGEMDFRALMKWLVTIEMVQRITEIRKGEMEIRKGEAEAFAASIKPMLDMMEKSRQELDAAAARAKESSMAIAEAAAMGAAGGVLGRVDARFEELKQQKADIATVRDPMKGLMARTMEMMMSRLTGMALPGGQVPPTPGMIDKRVQQQGG